MKINDNKPKIIQFDKLKHGEMFREPNEGWFGIKLYETLEEKTSGVSFFCSLLMEKKGLGDTLKTQSKGESGKELKIK